MKKKPITPPAVLRAKDAAPYVGISQATLYRLRIKGDFPKQIRLTNTSVGFRVAELDEWVKSRESA